MVSHKRDYCTCIAFLDMVYIVADIIQILNKINTSTCK